MVKLAVPFIKQQKKCDCWHAAAQMLYAYKRNSTPNPLPEVFAMKDCGVGLSDWKRFMDSAGLRSLPNPNVSYTAGMIQDMLCLHGPVIVVVDQIANNHALVVTGADNDGTIYYNDPFFGPEHTDLEFFNEEINHAFPIAYLD